MTIFTVFTGGTISCSDINGALSPDSKNKYKLLAMARQAGIRAAFKTAQPYTILSENLGAEHLKALKACILDAKRQGFDKLIVTHGTDTLQFTAAYLDAVLGKGLTAVLVSANYPLSDSRSNGLDNFVAAVRFLEQSDSKGVYVAYRNTGDKYVTVHRGSEVLPHRPYDDSVFSLFDNNFGIVENGVFVNDPGYRDNHATAMSGCEPNGNVLWIRPCIGSVYPEIPKGTKAVLLEGWHSGTLPTSRKDFRDFCRKAAEMNIPLFLTGAPEGFEYESKLAFGELKIHVLPPASPVSVYMRLWLLDADLSGEDIGQRLF